MADPSQPGAGAHTGLAMQGVLTPGALQGEPVIIADARIDNRGELADRLGLPRGRVAAMPAAELILAAYNAWGDQCPQYLLGDFAFVISDPPRQRLFCARDHLGIKPFFHARAGARFVFATDPAVVAAHDEIPDAVSEQAVALYLGTGDLVDERLTFYQAVNKLPPATAMTVDANGVREHCYWSPEAAPVLDLADQRDYVARLRELLASAVAVRLPDAGPVGAHLSGGLDSSGIAAIAGELLRDTGQALHTWTWVRPPASDAERANPEWALGQQVADHVGARHHHTHFDADALCQVLQQDLLRSGDTVDLWYEFAVRRDAAARGVKVMLSGWGGDQLISHNGRYRHAQTFWGGQPLATLRDLAEAARLAPRPLRRFLGTCYRDVLLPALPAGLNGRRRQFARMQRDYLAFASDDFAAWARTQQRPVTPYFGNQLRRGQLAALRRRLMYSRMESWAVSGARAGVEYRYPLLDKRVVEFALGLPPELYRAQGIDRFIYRQAVRQWLPEEIALATMKMEPVRVWELYGTGRDAVRQWLEQAPAQGNRYVSRHKLGAEIGRLADGQQGVTRDDVARLEAIWRGILALKL